MSEQNSPFTKLRIEEVTPAKRTLLDELNLPPKATKFIRDNAKALQTAVVMFLVLSSAWSFYNYYTQKQKNDSTALLAQAMQEKNAAARAEKLQKVVDDYAGSGAATWSRITQAHELVEKKDYTNAQEQLTAIAKDIGRDNPLFPLLQFDMAQVHELQGDMDQALTQYAALREISGFVIIGSLGEARIHEQKNDTAKAREIYEQLKAMTDLDPAARAWVDAKLAVK
jgi:predicted negative regulator of RcsB-dependent stress response